jgi:hypothetical protein
MKITIHKNEIAKYVVIHGTYKLGKEKMVRWVDVPEYLQVEPANVEYPQFQVLDPLVDKTRCICGHTRDSHTVQHDCNLCICAKFRKTSI